MAMDPSQLLQMLLQGEGGGTAISPTSGLREPSLSGLTLGPQGVGFGGGESLMGGGAFGGGFGGGGGGLGGLDISQLLAQLQAAPGVTGAGMRTPVGFGSLGGGFGAGGQLGGEPQGAMPTPSQQGQAGLGGVGTAAQLLGLLKEGVGLGKALTQIFPKGETPADLASLTQALPQMPPDVQAALSGVLPIGGAGPTPRGAGAFSLEQLMTPGGPPTFDLSQLMTPSGLAAGTGEALGPGGASALVGELGPGGQGVTGGAGLFQGLGGLPGVLGGAGVLSNLGFGALNLAQGNIGSGLGELLGTGAGLTLGAALAPETAGLSLLLGGLGGGGGGLLGGLFGGGGPSEDWRTFPQRSIQTEQSALGAAQALQQALQSAKGPQDILAAIDQYRQSGERAGIGGFSTRVTSSPFEIPWIPGMPPQVHGVSVPPFNEAPLMTDIQSQINSLMSQFTKILPFGWTPNPGQPVPPGWSVATAPGQGWA